MYSAFSFGKIIKTILPGSILAGTLFLIAEAVWLQTRGTSLLGAIIEKEAVTVAGAALVPVSLLLGFFLNTFVWLYLNATTRKQVDAALADTPFAQLREALCEQIRLDAEMQMGAARAERCRNGWPARLSLEYYFLPAITVEHLSYLWESYFSWYEFHLNSLCALAIASVTVIGVLLLMAPLDPAITLAICAVIAVICVAVCRTLWKSAIRNLTAYERNLVLLIANAVSAAPAATGTLAR